MATFSLLFKPICHHFENVKDAELAAMVNESPKLGAIYYSLQTGRQVLKRANFDWRHNSASSGLLSDHYIDKQKDGKL